jgi:hypothetical protein
VKKSFLSNGSCPGSILKSTTSAILVTNEHPGICIETFLTEKKEEKPGIVYISYTKLRQIEAKIMANTKHNILVKTMD